MYNFSTQKNFSSTLTRLADGFGLKKLTLLIIMIRLTPKNGSPAQIDSALLLLNFYKNSYIFKDNTGAYICQCIYVHIYMNIWVYSYMLPLK
jgi:hypothetical protein